MTILSYRSTEFKKKISLASLVPNGTSNYCAKRLDDATSIQLLRNYVPKINRKAARKISQVKLAHEFQISQ